MYLIKFSRLAETDKKMLKRAGLEKKAKELLNIIAQNPFQTPPPCEKLLGNLEGNYSRRINIQHRIVYEVFEVDESICDSKQYEGIVLVKRMWTHYNNLR